MNKQLLTIVGAVGVSLVVGAAAGYLFAQKRLQKAYDAILDEEIQATKDFYSRLHKTEFATPQDAAKHFGLTDITVVDEVDEALLMVVRGMQYGDPAETDASARQMVRNIFEPSDEDWVAEKEARTEDAPYILHADEFAANEPEYNQVELTYFEGDGILADEQNEHMPEPEKFIGDGQLLRFGYQSEDPNVVYIRNDFLEMDFCIKRSEGSYRREVLGLDDLPKARNGRRV